MEFRFKIKELIIQEIQKIITTSYGLKFNRLNSPFHLLIVSPHPPLGNLKIERDHTLLGSAPMYEFLADTSEPGPPIPGEFKFNFV